MTSDIFLALSTVLLLGAFHGVNPAMGWLFSVSLGLQEKSRRAVWTSLLPLAAGHLISVGLVLGAMILIGRVVPPHVLRYGVAALLGMFALFLFVRHRHPRFGGMRMTWGDLTIWSFLVATAHGAGLMVVPFLFRADAPAEGRGAMPHVIVESTVHSGHLTASTSVSHTTHAAALEALPVEPAIGLAAVIIHTIGYLMMLGLIAVVVYEKLGLRLLRTHWINLDMVWIASLLATALLTLIM